MLQIEPGDALKARGYRWMPETRRGIERAWWTELPPESVDAELEWLRRAIYPFGLLPHIPRRRVTARERWRADGPMTARCSAMHRLSGRPSTHHHEESPAMNERDHPRDAAPRCLAFVDESASRAETLLAGAAIEGAADAMRRARSVAPYAERLRLIARAAALRTHRDLAAALVAEGVPAPSARALAPHVARALGRTTLDALGPDAWVSLHTAHGVPAAEHPVLLRIARLVVEAAAALDAPRALSSAVVHIEPTGRSPRGPWPGVLAAPPELFGMSETATRAFLAELRERLVAARPGVRPWLPTARGVESTVALRPLVFTPFVVVDAATRAELERVGLPDAALPAPVRRLRCAAATANPSDSGRPTR